MMKCVCLPFLCKRRGCGALRSCAVPADLACTNLLHLGIGNTPNLRFPKVSFHFLFHYGCTVLKSMNVFKIYEDRCINNFEDVGLRAFVSLIPICNRVQWHGPTSHLYCEVLTLQVGPWISGDFLWGCVVAGPWRKNINRNCESGLLLPEWNVRFIHVQVFMKRNSSKPPVYLKKSKLSG